MMVTLAQAKLHLRITTPDGHPDDADLTLKLAAAEAVVTRFVARVQMGADFVAQWTSPDLTPADAQAAVLYQLGELWRFRGDDPAAVGSAPAREPYTDLSPVVMGLLRRFSHSVVS
jgi:hypothetical protein